jgi:hypothetical protein
VLHFNCCLFGVVVCVYWLIVAAFFEVKHLTSLDHSSKRTSISNACSVQVSILVLCAVKLERTPSVALQHQPVVDSTIVPVHYSLLLHVSTRIACSVRCTRAQHALLTLMMMRMTCAGKLQEVNQLIITITACTSA